MRFGYKSYSDPVSGASFLRPVIEIRIHKGEEPRRMEALVDSGADNCVFQGSIGDLLGIVVEDGKPHPIQGIKGERISGFLHDIAIEVGGHEFDCAAVFSHQLDHFAYGILGYDSFFQNFSVRLDAQKGEIDIRPLTR